MAENAPARFEVIAVDSDGKRVARPGVTFSWVREDTTYQWFQDNGEWKYQPTTRDRLIASGTVSIGAGASSKLEQAMPYGTYRLTLRIRRARRRPIASIPAGPRPALATGPTAFLSPPTSRLTRRGRRPMSTSSPTPTARRWWWWRVTNCSFRGQIDATAGGTDIDIPVSADWGAGAYVLVTAYRPLAQASPGASRYGPSAWLGWASIMLRAR